MELFAGIPWSQCLNKTGRDEPVVTKLRSVRKLIFLALRLLLGQLLENRAYPIGIFGAFISSHLSTGS